MKKYYADIVTGETTSNHREAVDWYRQGHEIAICNAETGEVLLTWEV